jgi:7,8-dihydro-6-hydroxymethylpterin-pyrophosphokinase
MVGNAGEVASEVKIRIRQRSQVLGKKGNFLMGREILEMMLDHFRTTSQDETLFNASHLYKLQYRGDKEVHNFLNAWLEIIADMKPEDIRHLQRLREG